MVEKFGLKDGYVVPTPMDSNVILSCKMSPTSENDKRGMADIPYRAAIGSLMWPSIATRPDITFATNKLSQFNANPGQAHWTAVQRVIRYLHGTKDLKLVLGGPTTANLIAYTDSDHASCIDSRRSTSGYLFVLGSGAISWSAK
jgi:hypothetical protein